MNEEIQELLMMYICDAYKNTNGKASKKTLLKSMKFVAMHEELQNHINNSNHKEVLKFRIK